MRIHKFGDLDADAAPGTPTASLPSWHQMRALAEADGPTSALLRQEAVDHAMEGFEPLPEEDTDPDKWQEKLDRTQKGAIACTIQNAWIILENDPALKGRIWMDTFSERLRCKGPFPWNDRDAERDWSDEDDAGIRWYLETIYHFSGVNKRRRRGPDRRTTRQRPGAGVPAGPRLGRHGTPRHPLHRLPRRRGYRVHTGRDPQDVHRSGSPVLPPRLQV